LLVLDLPEVFNGSLKRHSPSPEACDRLIATINRLSQVASKSGIMVLYAHKERASIVATPLSRFSMTKSNGKRRMRFDRRLKMVSKYTFNKRGEDAFSNRELDDFLRKKGVAHVFLAGVDSAMSIKQTAHSALDIGYRVTFIQDGIFTAYESRWERVQKIFESAAAFAIRSEEFAEFAMAVHQGNEAKRRPHEGGLPTPLATPATSS
jgi:nicotinamidase-related amidase